MKRFSRLLKYYKPDGAVLLAALFCTLVQCVSELVLPLLMARIVNRGTPSGGMLRENTETGWLLAVCAVLGASGYIAWMSCTVAGQRSAARIRNELYERIHSLSPLQVSKIGTGSVITRLTSDVDICSSLVSAVFQLLLEPLIQLTGGMILIWKLSPQIGAVYILFAGIQLLLMILFIFRTAPMFRRIQQWWDEMNASLQRTFTRLRMIKAFSAETREEEKYGQLSDGLFRDSFAAQKMVALFDPLAMLVMDLAVVFILRESGKAVENGSMNTGTLLAAITYTEQILLSILISGQLFRYLTRAKPSMERIDELLGMETDLKDGQETMEHRAEELAMESVSFQYPDGTAALRNVDLTLRPGRMTALTGPTGCGKSTVAGLLSRRFDPAEGTVRLGKRPLSEYRLADVRKTVAAVDKNPAILNGTVRENVIFGRENITEEAVRRALECAQADRIGSVEEPGSGQAEDMRVTGMGMSLSGGERQRIAIARALAGDPEYLILDDATSALDYETEHRLLESLRRSYPDTAVLLITQRVPGTRMADDICYMEQGTVFGHGSHRDLTRACAAYRKFCEVQSTEQTE